MTIIYKNFTLKFLTFMKHIDITWQCFVWNPEKSAPSDHCVNGYFNWFQL